MKNKRTSAFIIVILILAAAVVLFALFGRGGGVETPPVVLPTSALNPGAEATSPSGGGVSTAEVTPETVQAAIATLNRAESYSRTVTVENFWAAGSGSQTLLVRQSGANLRIRVEQDGKNILLVSGGSLYIWYDDDIASVYIGSFQDNAADEWIRCLTYEDMLDLPVSDISNAGYTEYAGESCVFAEYKSGSLGYRSIVYVSVATGLLMGAETHDGDFLTYRMTSATPDMSAPDESLFDPPVPPVS
ncbi:MAG: hypothetical protein RR314_05930 [Oscillospiraceae bacterium]